MTVDNSTKLTWCQNQVGFCTNVCQELTKGAEALDNRCDIMTLQYTCQCQGGVIPNTTASTATNGPQVTGVLPPGIFGNAANSNRGVQTWAAIGGSSVLGLIVFLTAGVLFGNHA
ncbi:hypothetical protein BGZ54_000639 [Gamsiella multidivaricata]|nr:hypothetical protein BGZ54_000639 [Gamsiella multidivaricata]